MRVYYPTSGDTLWNIAKKLLGAGIKYKEIATKNNISMHLKNIFDEGELERNSVVKKFLTTASDGKKYNVLHYNLDAIIAVGYRINSKKATEFRIWATKVLKEYITKGFALNDDKLKNLVRADALGIAEYYGLVLKK